MGPLTDHAFAARPLIPIAIGATIALAVAGGLAVRRFLLELSPDVLDERCPPRSASRRALRMIFGLALIDAATVGQTSLFQRPPILRFDASTRAASRARLRG